MNPRNMVYEGSFVVAAIVALFTRESDFLIMYSLNMFLKMIFACVQLFTFLTPETGLVWSTVNNFPVFLQAILRGKFLFTQTTGNWGRLIMNSNDMV